CGRPILAVDDVVPSLHVLERLADEAMDQPQRFPLEREAIACAKLSPKCPAVKFLTIKNVTVIAELYRDRSALPQVLAEAYDCRLDRNIGDARNCGDFIR